MRVQHVVIRRAPSIAKTTRFLSKLTSRASCGASAAASSSSGSCCPCACGSTGGWAGSGPSSSRASASCGRSCATAAGGTRGETTRSARGVGFWVRVCSVESVGRGRGGRRATTGGLFGVRRSAARRSARSRRAKSWLPVCVSRRALELASRGPGAARRSLLQSKSEAGPRSLSAAPRCKPARWIDSVHRNVCARVGCVP